jgi:hypothetical protein
VSDRAESDFEIRFLSTCTSQVQFDDVENPANNESSQTYGSQSIIFRWRGVRSKTRIPTVRHDKKSGAPPGSTAPPTDHFKNYITL